MRKLRVFVTCFKRSLTDLSYYRDIVNAKFTFSLKYLYVLMFIFGLVKGITLVPGVVKLITEIPDFKLTVKNVVDDLYPEELVVIIEGGKLSSNVEEPYFINFPNNLDTKFDEIGYDSGDYKNLIVIDTSGTVGDYTSYNSVFLVTEDSVVYPDDDTRDIGGYRVLPLKEMQSDMVIDKQYYDEMLGRLLPYLDYVPTVLFGLVIGLIVVYPFLVASFMTISRLFYLLFTSLVLLIIAKLIKRDLKYTKIYQLSIHTLTAPVLLIFLLELFSLRLPSPLFTVLFLGITGFVMVKAFNKDTSNQSPTTISESDV